MKRESTDLCTVIIVSAGNVYNLQNVDYSRTRYSGRYTYSTRTMIETNNIHCVATL